MASTNKTPNYELSQYVGSDKPTYLGDYNGDMLKIDEAMATNATSATNAVNIANNASTTAGNAQSTATTAQNTANNADSKATTAQGTADSALSLAQSVEDYLKITRTFDITTSGISSQRGTISNSTVKIATNNDLSFGKVYGNITNSGISGITTQTAHKITITGTSLRPSEEFTIRNVGISRDNNSIINTVDATFKTNGDIELNGYVYNGTNTVIFSLFPMFYTFINLGD